MSSIFVAFAVLSISSEIYAKSTDVAPQVSRSSLYAQDLALAEQFLKAFDTEATRLTMMSSEASWNYETDLTSENLEKTVNLSVTVSEFFLKASEGASKVKTIDLPPHMLRQISLIRRNADSASGELRKEVRELEGKMTSIFGKAKVCRKQKDGQCQYLTLEPDLTKIMRKSRDVDKLLFAWKGWRDEVGPKTKPFYEKIVDLLNIGAREHGYIDYGDFLRSEYEQGDDFELNLKRVWNDVKPLYDELHAFVRYRLKNLYRPKLNISSSGTIPAHVLGDMFAQNWENIFDFVKPYSNVDNFDVTEALKRKGYTVEKVFKLAESFFVSIGLYKMPDRFWRKSVLTKLKNKEMVCHASAWDFSVGDVRIKMCTQVNQNDLITVHHEMGHVEYFIAYQNQPYAFRNGANPGFHEAIGDTVALSVESPQYLKKIGILEESDSSEENVISFLLRQALRRVAPIPYNYLVDQWRWRVFAGNITEDNYNSEWWKLRTKYQGVSPPIKRKEDDFDPASKYHIGANVPYIAYFVSYVLQFQFHRSLCQAAGATGPLHDCSIYDSKEAGRKFRTMLEQGRSKPWPKILKEMTGERELSAKAIREYFEPLYRWLIDYRMKHRYPVGWGEEDLSEKVLHRKAGKFEPGQERSGILKTNDKGISLSINIPSLSVADNKGGATKNNDVQTERDNSDKVSVPMIDLAKLLSSGDRFTVSQTETSADTKDGSTTITNKEFNLSNDEDNSKSSKQGQKNSTKNSLSNAESNTTSPNPSNTTSSDLASDLIYHNTSSVAPASNTTGSNGSDVTKNSEPTNSTSQSANETKASAESANGTKVSAESSNQTMANNNVTSSTSNNNTAAPINQTLAWQSALLEKEGNSSLANNASVDTSSKNYQDGKNVTVDSPKQAQNASTRDKSPCLGTKSSSPDASRDCNSVKEASPRTISVTPGELIQHVLMKKVKNIVQKTLPEANVEKTKTGFTVNLDLNPKDEIPSRSQEIIASKTRQQHVNVFIAPKGVVVKPKSSDQLMKPSFVPVQNKDNLELRGGK